MAVWFFWSWTVAGALLLVGSGSAPGTSFLYLFLMVAWLAWGVQVWAVLLLSRREGRSTARTVAAVAAPPAVALGAWLLLWPAHRWSSVLWAHLELHRNRAAYQETVDRVALGGEVRGEVVLDEGPPHRVAFPWGVGMVDNWRAIVHDPTGLVLEANSSGGAAYDSVAGRARSLFGGDLCRVVHLSGPYYLCVFT